MLLYRNQLHEDRNADANKKANILRAGMMWLAVDVQSCIEQVSGGNRGDLPLPLPKMQFNQNGRVKTIPQMENVEDNFTIWVVFNF